jgi:hypothetical protein
MWDSPRFAEWHEGMAQQAISVLSFGDKQLLVVATVAAMTSGITGMPREEIVRRN